jgi:hypothetical protein
LTSGLAASFGRRKSTLPFEIDIIMEQNINKAASKTGEEMSTLNNEDHIDAT